MDEDDGIGPDLVLKTCGLLPLSSLCSHISPDTLLTFFLFSFCGSDNRNRLFSCFFAVAVLVELCSGTLDWVSAIFVSK
jgi:hypothetical protein